jgi:hypothetical protein
MPFASNEKQQAPNADNHKQHAHILTCDPAVEVDSN